MPKAKNNKMKQYFISYQAYRLYPFPPNTWTPRNDIISIHPLQWQLTVGKPDYVLLNWRELSEKDISVVVEGQAVSQPITTAGASFESILFFGIGAFGIATYLLALVSRLIPAIP
jgi:hypothetical protein